MSIYENKGGQALCTCISTCTLGESGGMLSPRGAKFDQGGTRFDRGGASVPPPPPPPN